MKSIVKQKTNRDVTTILLAEGKKQFLSRGSKGISIRKITEENGINLGSFVYHFKSKENFVHQIVESAYGDFLAKFNAELETIKPTASPVEKLERLLSVISKSMAENYQFIVHLILDTCAGEKNVIKTFAKEPPKHLPIIMNLIVQSQEQKLIRSDMTTSEVYIMCISAIMGSTVIARQLGNGIRNVKAKQFISSILDNEFEQKRIDFVMKGLRV